MTTLPHDDMEKRAPLSSSRNTAGTLFRSVPHGSILTSFIVLVTFEISTERSPPTTVASQVMLVLPGGRREPSWGADDPNVAHI